MIEATERLYVSEAKGVSVESKTIDIRKGKYRLRESVQLIKLNLSQGLLLWSTYVYLLFRPVITDT